MTLKPTFHIFGYPSDAPQKFEKKNSKCYIQNKIVYWVFFNFVSYLFSYIHMLYIKYFFTTTLQSTAAFSDRGVNSRVKS